MNGKRYGVIVAQMGICANRRGFFFYPVLPIACLCYTTDMRNRRSRSSYNGCQY